MKIQSDKTFLGHNITILKDYKRYIYTSNMNKREPGKNILFQAEVPTKN